VTRLLPLVAGLLFGFGLILSGMIDPERVLGFLDVAGRWNPSLALVMGGAVVVTLPAFAYVRRTGHSLSGASIALPDRRRLTRRLILGSALFGAGWGLAGICPGPGLVIATAGSREALVFLVSMLAGMALYAGWSRWQTAGAAPAPEAR